MMTKRSSHMPTLTNIAVMKSHARAGAEALEPHQLRRQAVADDEASSTSSSTGPRSAVRQHEALEDVAAVAAEEGFHGVASRRRSGRWRA